MKSLSNVKYPVAILRPGGVPEGAASLGFEFVHMQRLGAELLLDAKGVQRWDVFGNATVHLAGCAPLHATARAATLLDEAGRLLPITDWLVRSVDGYGV